MGDRHWLYDSRHGNRSTALIYILTTGQVPGYPVEYLGNELPDNGSPTQGIEALQIVAVNCTLLFNDSAVSQLCQFLVLRTDSQLQLREISQIFAFLPIFPYKEGTVLYAVYNSGKWSMPSASSYTTVYSGKATL